MKPSHLVACPFCARHVRVSEQSCPFCNGQLPEAFRSTPARRPPSKRLSRGALYAFGAGTLTLAATTACSSTSSGSGSTQKEEDAGGDSSRAVAAYGAPSFDGGIDFDGQTGALYGAPAIDGSIPPTLDAAYGGPPTDSGQDATAVAAYGAPSFDGGFGQGD